MFTHLDDVAYIPIGKSGRSIWDILDREGHEPSAWDQDTAELWLAFRVSRSLTHETMHNVLFREVEKKRLAYHEVNRSIEAEFMEEEDRIADKVIDRYFEFCKRYFEAEANRRSLIRSSSIRNVLRTKPL